MRARKHDAPDLWGWQRRRFHNADCYARLLLAMVSQSSLELCVSLFSCADVLTCCLTSMGVP